MIILIVSFPVTTLTNFDLEAYNNLWLATPKGLVGFNNTGLILRSEELKSTIEGFKIYPNPAKDFIEINFLSGEPVSIEITNTLGKNIESKVTALNAISLSTHNLKSGLYYLTLKTKRKTLTAKFIKE